MPSALLVALVSLASAASVAASIPHSFTVSGGGFQTMVGGQAAARALAEVGFDFSTLTHVSGNSGGGWFATQFLYNNHFKDALTEKKCTSGMWWWKTEEFCSMQSVLSDWGKRFSQRVAAANLAPATPLSCDVNVLGVNLDIKPLLSLFQASLSLFSLPASDWRAYVTALLDIPGIHTLTYSDATKTLDVTLTQMLGVPQSVFLGDRASGGSTTLAAPCASSGDAVTRGAYLTRLSAASAASVPDLSALRFADGQRAFATRSGTACGATEGDAVLLSFPDSASLLVKDVTAISSAAAGGVGSHQYAEAFTRVLAVDEVLADFTTEIADEVAACFPLGLLDLAPPLSTVPPSSFRGIDGGYIDNTAILPSLSALMRQCAAGDASLECMGKRFSMLFVGGFMQDYRCLFRDGCASESDETRDQYGVRIFDTTVFAETFPSDWAKYTTWYAISSRDSVFNFGTFTTVENKAYGIEAGWRVSLLAFIIVADELVYPIIAPANTAELTFSTLYTIVANEQIEGFKTVLKNWMAADEREEHLTMTSLSVGLESEPPKSMTQHQKTVMWVTIGVSAFLVAFALVGFICVFLAA